MILKATQQVKQWYLREELPQIGKRDLESINYKIRTVNFNAIVPTQKERIRTNFLKQLERFNNKTIEPIVVDKYYRIVNGHHRYSVYEVKGINWVKVAYINKTLEELMEQHGC